MSAQADKSLCSPLEDLGQTTSRKHTYIKFDPLKLHFYIVKLGLKGYTLFFLISAQNIDCGYSLTSTHNLCFEQKCENIGILSEKLSVFGGEVFEIFE